MSDHTPKPDNENNGKKKEKLKDKDKEEAREHEEEGLDDALEDTFPASDPIAPQDPSKPGRG